MGNEEDTLKGKGILGREQEEGKEGELMSKMTKWQGATPYGPGKFTGSKPSWPDKTMITIKGYNFFQQNANQNFCVIVEGHFPGAMIQSIVWKRRLEGRVDPLKCLAVPKCRLISVEAAENLIGCRTILIFDHVL